MSEGGGGSPCRIGGKEFVAVCVELRHKCRGVVLR
jgi:hypothetical protein